MLPVEGHADLKGAEAHEERQESGLVQLKKRSYCYLQLLNGKEKKNNQQTTQSQTLLRCVQDKRQKASQGREKIQSHTRKVFPCGRSQTLQKLPKGYGILNTSEDRD